MGNLGDALRRAGLVSEKELKKQKHEQRVQRKKTGREGLQAEQRSQEQARRQRQEQSRSKDRQREKERQSRKQDGEGRAQARDLMRSHAITSGLKGRRRYHFVDQDGRIPYLMVDDQLGRRLDGGECGIATDGRQIYVVPRDLAARVAEMDEGLVLFLNGS